MKKILDVGCGNRKTIGAVGIDISKNTQADIIHDLNKLPWPFEDSSFDKVICNDALEHLNDVILSVEEIHRISKPGAVINIRVPHYTSHNSFSDVTHKNTFGVQSFNGFCEKSFTQSHYSDKRLKMISSHISFGKFYKLIEIFANKFPDRYERYSAFIFPAGNIEFKFTVIK